MHHSAEVLTPLTLYRVHPIESLFNQWRGALVAGVVTGLFMWAFPGRLRAFEILGVDALGFVWTTVGANLRHSHVWLPFPPWLERWLVSPAQHQLHHARDSARFGNYGSALAIWDTIFGTAIRSKGTRPPRVGLPRDEVNHAPNVLSLVVAPLVAAFRVLVRSASKQGSATRRFRATRFAISEGGRPRRERAPDVSVLTSVRPERGSRRRDRSEDPCR